MKKLFRLLLLLVFATTVAVSFTACDDDDNDTTTEVTQVDILKYIPGTTWAIDGQNDKFFFAEGGMGVHSHGEGNSAVASHIGYEVKGNTIVITYRDYWIYEEGATTTIKVLSINAKTMKGTMTIGSSSKTYTFTKVEY